MGDDRGDYGPWMLVGRKKQGSKPQATHTLPLQSNLEQISTLNAKYLGRLLRLSPEGNPPNRPPTASPDGKRKTKRFDNFSSNDHAVSFSQDTASIDALKSKPPKTTLSTSTLKKADLVSTSTFPNSNPPRFGTHTIPPKVNNRSKPKQKTSTASHGGQPPKTMGNKPPRKDYEPISIFYPTDQSIPHHDLGMVQLRATTSMEPHIPPNPRESKARLPAADKPEVDRVGKPLVEISNGQPVSSKREVNGLESTITNFAGSSFARIKPFGGGSNQENLGGNANSNKGLWKQSN